MKFQKLYITGEIAFQFHKGAIGVNGDESDERLTERFQFHKGAIGVKEVSDGSV